MIKVGNTRTHRVLSTPRRFPDGGPAWDVFGIEISNVKR